MGFWEVTLEEKKIALIPNVVGQEALGPKNYGILITNERSIFVLQRSSKAMIGGIIGGAIGAAVMGSVAAEREVDYLHTPIEILAAMKGTISVSRASC